MALNMQQTVSKNKFFTIENIEIDPKFVQIGQFFLR